MEYKGVLTKMQTELADPIQYFLVFDEAFLHMNQLLGKVIRIQVTGSQCLNCKKNKRIWRQGFCYDCFWSSPAVGSWVMRPELSSAHLDIEDRDLAYEKRVQLQPHVVYLAASCEVKVGVTRASQIPTRWIDQGACSAAVLLEVPNRYLAGITEVALKEMYTDKINWRKMLANDVNPCDLLSERIKCSGKIPSEAREYFEIEPRDICTLNYPVLYYPTKITSISLDKQPQYCGELCGIKGQYLLFTDGSVINIRASEGLEVSITI
jgi:hypothetical protein